VNPKTLAIVLFLGLIGLAWFFFPRGERKTQPKRTPGEKKVASTPPPEVKPVAVSKSAKQETPEEKKAAVDTAWDKDGDGVVDAGFTGVRESKLKMGWGVLNVETPYKNGKKNGLQRTFHKDGTLNKEEDFRDGLLHGFGRSFYSEGVVYQVHPYRLGKVHGKVITYRENGDVFNTVDYVEGKRHGLRIVYTKSKIMFLEQTYVDDKLTIAKEFQDYNLIRQYTHDNIVGKKVVYDKAKGIDLREK